MNKGFSIIELLIVIAIIGILIAIAVPSYRTYTRRARYTEVVQAVAPYKLGVEECYQITDDVQDCIAGDNGIPPAIAHDNGSKLIDSVDVQNGVITVTPKNQYGINSKDTYVLTPVIREDKLLWTAGGGGVAAGYAS